MDSQHAQLYHSVLFCTHSIECLCFDAVWCKAEAVDEQAAVNNKTVELDIVLITISNAHLIKF